MKFGFGSSTEKNGVPHIETVNPTAAIPGGEMIIRGSGLAPRMGPRPSVHFGEADAGLMLVTENRVVVRVPDGATDGTVRVVNGNGESAPHPVSIGSQIADNLHPVGNPAVDIDGNIYVTFSGPRGEPVPVSLYKVSPVSGAYSIKPFVTSLTNPSGLALDRGAICSSHAGTTARSTASRPKAARSNGSKAWGSRRASRLTAREIFYVGDRSGTIFKISPSREIFVFATLEPSVAAYHLAFHPSGDLFVTGPTTSSFDRVYRITQGGEVSSFFRGLGRPQGFAFDREGNLYVAASYLGRRGIVRITADSKAEVVLGGSGLVGLALLPSGRAILTTNAALFALDWDVRGLPLLG